MESVVVNKVKLFSYNFHFKSLVSEAGNLRSCPTRFLNVSVLVCAGGGRDAEGARGRAALSGRQLGHAAGFTSLPEG